MSFPRTLTSRNTRFSSCLRYISRTHAQPLAYYDHPFFGHWPAITRNQFGSGTLTYEGTWLNEKRQTAVVSQVLGLASLLNSDQTLPSSVRVTLETGKIFCKKRANGFVHLSSITARPQGGDA
uniref:beta-galactosidase trimerization domain-containing protein n=1 Tax=Tunturiibacter empetritectus TaxID=3069691 RepID=UPI0021A6EB62|nr:beta-galactosidase trimerization domain-containing protein [Edaphobacter lichenicola]